MRNWQVWIGCALAALLYGGCATYRPLVPGLTLPPGAVVLKASTDSVAFDCKAGWTTVSNHIEQSLSRQGYSDVTTEYQLQPSEIGHFRIFKKPGNAAIVSLYDSGELYYPASQGQNRPLTFAQFLLFTTP